MTLQLGEADAGREIELTVGESFTLALAENPTTGFRWQVQSDGGPACELVSDEFEPPAEGAHGRGGLHHWQFRAARGGEGQIELTYRRGFAGGGQPPTRAVTLRVRVTG